MCGLTGFFDRTATATDGQLLSQSMAMAEEISYRGPDDARAWVDEGVLSIALKTEGGFAAKGVNWNVGVDVDGDDTFEVVFGFNSSKRPWVGRALESFADTDWHPNLTARLAISGNTAELLLPISALGLQGSVRLYPYTVSGEPLKRVDAAGWLKVELPPMGGR